MRDMISSAVAGGILALLALLLGSLPTGDSRPWVDAVAWVSGDPVPGCDAVYEAGGVRAAVCQPDRETTEIRILGGDGTSRLLATHSVSDGFWREALPSPDGRWVLAQWSGPCEVPVAYLFPAAGGEGRPVAGPDTETAAVGWAPDGRAIVDFLPGACGEGISPGTYIVDPRTLERRRIQVRVG